MAMGGTEERNIILLGKLGAGKSHSGNGILGLTNHFKSEKGWSSKTLTCEYGSAERNGRKYRVLDTPGINSIKAMNDTIDVDTEIIRCLFCTSPGFHVIVLVLSADERLTSDDVKMVEKLDKVLGEKGFGYMMLAVTKMDDDYEKLEEQIESEEAIKKLYMKCNKRRVILGNNNREIPETCLQRFDKELESLVMKNRRNGEEYFRHKYYKKAGEILERDKADYMKDNEKVTSEQAMEKVRELAALGQSPRDEELRALVDRSHCSCTIS